MKDIKTPENASKSRQIIGGTLWLIATARNALLVLFTSMGAYWAEKYYTSPFILTGTVKSGVPGFQLPPFETTVMGANGTTTELNFMGMVLISSRIILYLRSIRLIYIPD